MQLDVDPFADVHHHAGLLTGLAYSRLQEALAVLPPAAQQRLQVSALRTSSTRSPTASLTSVYAASTRTAAITRILSVVPDGPRKPVADTARRWP
ncbi:hypothetical protein ACFRKE_01395 [Kitasatospora indigofera]|uniref:hypothetical protein n=1 Tax=Kitasatospora indigofera TaxID=67307 RepID=UPI0036AC9925